MNFVLDRGLRRKEVTIFVEDKGPCEYHEHKRLGNPCYKLRRWN